MAVSISRGEGVYGKVQHIVTVGGFPGDDCLDDKVLRR